MGRDQGRLFYAKKLSNGKLTGETEGFLLGMSNNVKMSQSLSAEVEQR